MLRPLYLIPRPTLRPTLRPKLHPLRPTLLPSLHLSTSTSLLNSFNSLSFGSPESTSSSNNPWSPTLLDDPVTVKKGLFRSESLPSNFRLSYLLLYEAPGAKYVSLLKRLTLSFGVLGGYGGKLLYESPHFDNSYALAAIGLSLLPILWTQYKTHNYVTRIFRLYNKDEPQTLENLVKDETLIMEKLGFTGGKTYNEMVKVNQDLKLDKSGVLLPYSSWTDGRRKFYVSDDIGGIKMDRIWGIVERNSGVENGRSM